MNKIFETLREAAEEGEDVHISSEDMKTLVDILGIVGVLLRERKIWFNKKSTEENLQYIKFCERISNKFANIKIEMES